MEIPYFQQETRYTCGAAALRMVLASMDIKRSEKLLSIILKTSARSGVRTDAFPRVAEKYKLRYVVGRNATLSDVEEILERDYRVIVGYWHVPEKVGHYAVVTKITPNHVYLHDPDPYTKPNKRYNREYFERLWKKGFKYDKDSTWFIGMKK